MKRVPKTWAVMLVVLVLFTMLHGSALAQGEDVNPEEAVQAVYTSSEEAPVTLRVGHNELFSFRTVQEAVYAVHSTNVTSKTTFTIEIAGGEYSDGPIQIKQHENKNIILQPAKGADVTFTDSAYIQIDGMGRYYGTESLTIKGITFDFHDATQNLSCIAAYQLEPGHHIYVHNVVVEGCRFIGTGTSQTQVVAVSTPASGGHAAIKLTDCVAENTYALFSGYTTDLTVERCNVVTTAGSGINEQGGGNLAVRNSYFDVTKYGIRSGSGKKAPASGKAIVVENCFIRSRGDGETDDETVIVLRGGAPSSVQISRSALVNPDHPVLVLNYAGEDFSSKFTLDMRGNYWENPAGDRPAEDMFKNFSLKQVLYDPWYTDVDRTKLASEHKVLNLDRTTVYSSIQEAVDAAQPGDTIIVGPGTYDEEVVLTNSVKLYGANHGNDPNAGEWDEGNNTVLTGGIVNSPAAGVLSGVEIKGFEFKENGIKITGWTGSDPVVLDNLTIANNRFLDIGRNSGGNAAAIHLNLSDTADDASNLTITSNRIVGVMGAAPSGINVSVCSGNSRITHNYIENVYHNSIQVTSKATGTLDISHNVLKNWDSDMNGEGRALRLHGVSAAITVSHNVMVKDGEPQEGYLKASACGPIDARLNYWNGTVPSPETVVADNDIESAPWYLDSARQVRSDELRLDVTVNGQGTVTVEPAQEHYEFGTEVRLTATPAAGWRFAGWSGDLTGNAASVELVMDYHKAVTATFQRVPVVTEPSGPSTPPVEPPVVAPSVTETVDAETGGTVELEDGSAGVVLPPNAVVEDVVVTIAPVTEVTQPTAGMVMIAGKVFEITAETEDGELVTQFSEPIALTFTLTEEELEEAEVNLEDLRVFYWDEKAGAWIALPTRVDPETGTVTAVTDHFTVFAVMAKPDMPALSDIEGHWGEKDILRLVSLGVVGGYEDGTFRPEAGITRQEFAKMVVLAAGLEPDVEPELTFADTDEIAEWARGYVSAAVKAGIITGVGDNRFAPTDPVTRAQAATMIMRSLGEVETALELTFADAETIPEWAKAAILGALEKGIVTGFEDNTFKPDLSATRVQAAKMLSKLTVVRFED